MIVTQSLMTEAGFQRLCRDENEPLFLALNLTRDYLINDATGKRIGQIDGGNPTIGFGRNLIARGVRRDEAVFMASNDVADLWASIAPHLLWLLPKTIITDVVIMVEYNTGDVLGFPRMLAAMQAGDLATAQAELMNSRAANEAPERYGRMRDALANLSWP